MYIYMKSSNFILITQFKRKIIYYVIFPEGPEDDT